MQQNPTCLLTSKKLKLNDLILVDAGIKYKRYCSDRNLYRDAVGLKKFFFKEQNSKWKTPKNLWYRFKSSQLKYNWKSKNWYES